jgi:carbonic anhydrase/acetyltransferase-like protein (isoleucine patch superfamily)
LGSYPIGPFTPRLAPTVTVHPDAEVAGEVRIGPRTVLWPHSLVQGLYGAVELGAGIDVQDGATVTGHVGQVTVLGDRCIVGAAARLEGCTVGTGCLIGPGALVLPGAVIGDHAVVGAGVIVRGGMTVPPGSLAVGSPARVLSGAR